MKAVTDGERLQKVIDQLQESAHSISIKLGYSSPASIYHVLNGINVLSKGMQERIVKTFPNVNHEFLRDGTGDVLLKGEELQEQMSLFNMSSKSDANSEFELFKKFMSIPDKLDKIIELLENRS